MEHEEDMENLIVYGLAYGLPLFLAALGLVAGTILERRHFASIRRREARFADYPAVPARSWDRSRAVVESRLVSASVVVSADYFKRILASFRNLFGGNVRSYETLLDRARREAILRLKEQAPNGHLILNLRLATSNISSSQQGTAGLAAVEVLAVGTAVRYADEGKKLKTES